MTESELLFHISKIVNGSLSFPQAAEQIRLLLTNEANCRTLIIEHPDRPSDAAKLLESLEQPYRSLYSVDLLDGGQTLGRATLCFASNQLLGSLPQRLSDFAGQQLGMLLARTRLAEKRARLKREIEKIEDDLATRKVMQRAEGILIAKRGMAAIVARRWIAQQSEKTGLSTLDVADRIIAYDQAIGLREQRIA